jgi:hypothetical protein|tara:strand:+ start:174 stop:1361 length:1188 start_codon:yes stop_codon:yes gene_type:complete
MPEFSQQHRSQYGSGFYIQELGTAEFYGLEFIDTFEDKIIPNQNLVTKPSVLIQGSTILFDYSDGGDPIDRSFLDTLFTSMNSAGGTFSSGFTISGAIYNDPIRNYSADLAASCTLSNYSNHKILGTFSSIGSTIETNFYHPEFFETVPQISSAVGLTSGVTLNGLINYPTSKDTSFVGNNFQQGDYLDFATSSNNGRFIISGITVDRLDREIITFDNSILVTPEDLKGTQVIASHVRKTSTSTNGPYDIELDSAIVHRVGLSIVDGVSIITIDSEIEKPLVLTRGIMYLFVVDNQNVINMQFLDETQTAPYTETGIYSVTDKGANKKCIFFIPNNETPNQLYYNSSGQVSGIGGIQITGSYLRTNDVIYANSANATVNAESSLPTGNSPYFQSY